ncbi:MAG: hypothetical protein GY913_21995 [Proteobacteria bacterium]|nr:hypothetical protein [Pseudomonadota bacterium]MCP4919584.1 hypothetical protein [Pseudomonadota bacterium]
MIRLVEQGDWRGTIRLVERWSVTGEPTPAARLGQARAFLSLRLMDRAWVRLKEVADAQPDDVETLALTAEMFIERGWPVRARKLLERCQARRPEDARILGLVNASKEPPRAPASNARELEKTGTHAQQLELAERFMASGSFLRAKAILERLNRVQGDFRPRVEDLLWGLGAEFAREEGDPMALARALLPDLLGVSDDSGGDMYSSSEVTSAGERREVEGDHENFPSLFRRVDQLEEGHTTEEVTLISKLATLEELQRRDPTDDTFSGYNPNSREADTQIRMVIRKDGQDDEDDRGHVKRDEEHYKLHETLNLKDYLASVGMQAPDMGGDLDDDEVNLEEEDEDLVVVTKREVGPEDPTAAEPDTQELGRPIEVIEQPLPGLLEPIVKQQREIPEFDPVTVGEPAPPIRERLPREPSESEELVPIGGFNAGPRVVALIVAVLVVGALVVKGGMGMADRLTAAGVVDETLATISSGQYAAVRDADRSLDASLAAHVEPRGAYQAAAGLVDLVLWAEYTGDPQHLASARQALDRAAELGAPDEALSLATAYRAYYEGDLELAATTLTGLERSAEVARLDALVAAERGQREAAMTAADEAVALGAGPRYHLSRSKVCQQLGDTACATASVEAALGADAGHPEAMLQSLVLLSAERSPTAQIRGLDGFLKAGELPPRVAGAAHARKAELHARLGQPTEAAAALDAAVAIDPANPELLYALGARYVRDNRLLDALASLESAVQARPSELRFQAARLRVLTELDRVDEAVAALEALPSAVSAHPRRPVLDATVQLVSLSDPETALKTLDPLGSAGDPEVRYLQGLAYGELDRPLDAEPLLLQSAPALRASEDPFTRRLGARAYAAAALYGLMSADQAATAEGIAGADPIVWVLLGDFYDGVEDVPAGPYYDHAIALGPDNALALYAHGQFYLDARDNLAQTRPSWSAYLDLDPSGERARRARDRLGR